MMYNMLGFVIMKIIFSGLQKECRYFLRCNATFDATSDILYIDKLAKGGCMTICKTELQKNCFFTKIKLQRKAV